MYYHLNNFLSISSKFMLQKKISAFSDWTWKKHGMFNEVFSGNNNDKVGDKSGLGLV